MAATISNSPITLVKRTTPDSSVKNASFKRHRNSQCYINSLPSELYQKIFKYLTLQELVYATLVGRQFNTQVRLKIHHHANRLFFSPDKLEKISLRELCGYIESVRYMISYLTQEPEKLARGLLREALCWKDSMRTSVDAKGTLRQLQIPFPERDCTIIYRMANERFAVVDRDHLFIHGARSLPWESKLTIAVGIFFQFVETVKIDACLTKEMSQSLQGSLNFASAIPTQRIYREGIMRRLMLYYDTFKG